ncbi:MAG: beta-propeller domain-containing protein [Proteobacteria bacterium]|nr:beta-propeller domain-containing protein [Pseudomonadota bacterium]
MKNDGNTIYLLADGRFQVFDAWPAQESHRISATAIEGEPKKMFVLGDRAVVYSSLPAVWTGDPVFDMAGYYGGECTYGYDCELVGDGHPLKITVLDISDLTAPEIVREIDFGGSLVAGRAIDGATFTMVVFPQMGANVSFGGDNIPVELEGHWNECGPDLPFSQCEIQRMFDALIEQYAAEIAALEPESILPGVRDRRLVGGEWIETSEQFADCESFFVSESGDGLNQISLFTFDPAQEDDLGMTSIIDRPGAVYANATSMYVASRHYAGYDDEWYFDDPAATPEATTVHKFVLDPAARTAEYAGSGVVKGRVLNQFSMDEHDGDLRIATTTGHLPSADTHSTVSVLGETDGSLELVGQVDHIAPSEDIRSVRFSGDQGYVVTFEKTDPLFVLDLADPTAPAVVGELVIPGFSTYMHLMGADHLLTIGYDADDMGDFSWFQGVRLQIFDISEPTNPLLDHVEVIGSRGSTSEATTNHLAFNYFASRDLLALPMTICEGGDEGMYGYDMTFSGLLVYNVTTEDGFTQLGGVPHAAPTAGDDYETACGNWWTNGNSAVKRSVFMEDYVFSIATDLVNVASVSALSDVLVSLDLTAP